MKLRNFLVSSLAFLSVSAWSMPLAQATNLTGAELVCPQAVVSGETSEFFKAGVKFDPEKHQWVDRYNGKSMYLGLPGVTERFGANSVISAVTPPPSSANATTAATTSSTFPWKKVITFTVIGCGIATAIAVPIACGVSAGHHHQHHLQNNRQANQAAAYYYYHNQTLGLPTFQQPAPVFIPHHGKPAPPPKFL